MLRATVIGFDGAAQVYSSDEHATHGMGELFDALAGGRGYEIAVEPAGGVGGVFGSDLYENWTFADEARERSAATGDATVTYRLLPEE